MQDWLLEVLEKNCKITKNTVVGKSLLSDPKAAFHIVYINKIPQSDRQMWDVTLQSEVNFNWKLDGVLERMWMGSVHSINTVWRWFKRVQITSFRFQEENNNGSNLSVMFQKSFGSQGPGYPWLSAWKTLAIWIHLVSRIWPGNFKQKIKTLATYPKMTRQFSVSLRPLTALMSMHSTASAVQGTQ